MTFSAANISPLHCSIGAASGRVRFALLIVTFSVLFAGCKPAEQANTSHGSRQQCAKVSFADMPSVATVSQVDYDVRAVRPPSSNAHSLAAGAATHDAIAALTGRLDSAPNDLEARIDRGELYCRVGDLDKAEADLAFAVELAPSDPRALFTYGYLLQRRGRLDAALAAYTKVIELRPCDPAAFCNRGSVNSELGQHRGAISDWTAAIRRLDPISRRSDEQTMQSFAYLRRGCAWMELADWERALTDFKYLSELDPNSLIPWVQMSRVHFAQRDYDDFAASLFEAIRLNPSDAGKDYAPVSSRELSADSLEHGTGQLRKMLADRPLMAQQIGPGDELWTWAVRKFAGEDTGTLVDWEPSEPSPFEADSGRSRISGRLQIRVSAVIGDSPTELDNAFDRLWRRAVFELHNIAATEQFDRIGKQATDGMLSSEEYVLAMIDAEDLAEQNTRAFYLKLYLPWARSRRIVATSAAEWYCFSFYAGHGDREAYWRTTRQWGYYSVWFHLLQAQGDWARGNYGEMAKQLTAAEALEIPLTSDQITALRYWRIRLAKATSNSPSLHEPALPADLPSIAPPLQ